MSADVREGGKPAVTAGRAGDRGSGQRSFMRTGPAVWQNDDMSAAADDSPPKSRVIIRLKP